ncbi:hypothetical protein [Humisphaera borealis]|uniref:Prepilin-type N-terminal cleavage/methylation domain-containing protein n=1 Tax=Humisphaera borealis TaxID=2807512 RepID=A0A7M2X2W7_9BACT|nr:hypothetical protein [Humisphaera borealis]QOV91772.1 hypothetical protein IPV69_10615 [Humisphaera borealis]
MARFILHPSSFILPARRRRSFGFTLNELLVVIALAVLILALALPAFNAITGSRTLESAENQISSYLASTRAQAIGLQEPRGVVLFTDAGTGRVTLVQVQYPPGVTRPQIDLLGVADDMALPVGVGLQAVPNGTGASGSPPAYPWPATAIVMFDGDGKLLLDNVSYTSTSNLGKRLRATANFPTTLTNIGFVLYDKPAYDSQVGAAAQKKWMDENAIPFLVNRYNGTLLRGE